ncbi:MAG TPA: DUF502 domain-containing protein [Polyangia bacterium]
MKRIARYFVQGLIILVPIALTFWLLAGIFVTLDSWTREQIAVVWPGTSLPGVGFLTMLLLITGTGFLGSHFFTRRLVAGFERVLEKLPVVKMLHGSLRDLMSAVVGPARRFDQPVAVDLAGGVRGLGFITRDSMAHFGLPEHVAVYFPQAYNFAGQVLLVPRPAVMELPVPSSDVMTFIVSGGVAGRAPAAPPPPRLTGAPSSP